MHPLFSKADSLTERIIACALEVHRDKGPGLIESIYEWCLLCELSLARVAVESQRAVKVRYKNFVREESLRFDVLVEGCVLVEAKAVAELINFNALKLTEGVSRLILPGANR